MVSLLFLPVSSPNLFPFVGVISADAPTDTLDLFSTIKRLILLTCFTVVSA